MKDIVKAFDKPLIKVIGWGFAVMAATFTIHDYALSYFDKGSIINWGNNPAIKDLVESSSLPMYFTDCNMKIKYCNKEFAAFANLAKDKINGLDVSNIIEHAKEFVPLKSRKKFRSEQMALLDKARTKDQPSADYVTVMDFSNHPNHSYRGKYKVKMHVDKVLSSSKEGKELGHFVIIVNERLP